MKKLVLVALIVSLLSPVSAQAAETKFSGGPLTNLDYQGATVNITLSNVPAKGGLYIQQCVEAPAGSRSALCNKAVTGAKLRRCQMVGPWICKASKCAAVP